MIHIDSPNRTKVIWSSDFFDKTLFIIRFLSQNFINILTIKLKRQKYKKCFLKSFKYDQDKIFNAILKFPIQ